MIYPTVDEIRTKVDSKYTLIALVAKRARDIVDGKPRLTDKGNLSPISTASYEVVDELISYKRNEE